MKSNKERKGITEFRRLVQKYGKEKGRTHLPWRKTRNPYRVLVSEVMLQQTQVERVIPYYREFLRKFATPQALAKAPLSDVLRAWQGLGYNRRAKMLHEAAKMIVRKYKGKLPNSVEELETLPGIGPYTARAVAAFAYNEDVVFIETNIRTAVMHHFFAKKKGVSDTEVAAILTATFPKGKAREWYSALMDYGSYLKQSGVRLNAKSKHYAKQEAFSGSYREARGAILRALAKDGRTSKFLIELLGEKRREQLRAALASLTKEGLIELKGGKFRLPD